MHLRLCTCAWSPPARSLLCMHLRAHASCNLQGPSPTGGADARRIPDPARTAGSCAGCVPPQLCTVLWCMFSMCVHMGAPWKTEPKPRDLARLVHPLAPEVRRFLSRTGLSGLVGRPRVMPCGACMFPLMRTHAYNPMHACRPARTQLRGWSVEQAQVCMQTAACKHV